MLLSIKVITLQLHDRFMYCQSCGEEIPDGSGFCTYCGTELRQEPTSTNTEPTQADTDGSAGLTNKFGKVGAYIVGVFLILSGLAVFADSVLAGLVLLAGGVLALPVVRSELKESQGIALGTWGAVAIVIVSIVAGGALAPSTDQTPSTEQNRANPADTPTTIEQQLIQKPATDLVIQLDQLEVGWSGGVDGNETYAEGRFFQSQEDAILQTTVEKFDTVESGDEAYTERTEEIQNQHATESVNVGDEGILYITSNSAWVVFRDANVVAEVRFTKEFATDREERVRKFTNKMYENFAE